MTNTHPLLERQLRRLGVDAASAARLEWAALLDTVAQTYHEADQDRQLLERSLTISSRELRELNQDLARSSETRLAHQRDELLAANAIQAAVLEAAPDGILVIDGHREVVMCNRRFAELWGIPAEVVDSGDDLRLLGYALAQLVDPDAFLRKVETLYADPTAHSEDELRLVDGRLIERFSRPAIDADGLVRGRLWIFRDVTTRRQDEARVREAHAFLDSIVETLPNMVFVKDAAELRFVRFNRAGELLVGLPRSQLLGRSDHDLFPAEQADRFVAKDREVLAQRDAVTIAEEELQTGTGTRVLRTRKIGIFDADGQPTHLLGISEDITEEKERAVELVAARERAEVAGRARSDFLLNMSHELRTPLNAILGFARVLGRTASDRLTGDERDHLADIVTAGEHMLRLVNDLLDLRRLEAHQLDDGIVDVRGPVAEAVRMASALVHEREIALDVDLPEQLPACRGDHRAIVQVLVNLLSNAAKFTPVRGRITIAVASDPATLSLRVADTGIGIAAADQGRLFQYFEQLGAKHIHHMKGSGVGLALTRALVEKMGGTIGVESEPGVGSTFTVNLRRAS